MKTKRRTDPKDFSKFTDEEMETAKNTDLPDLLEHLGYQVRQVGRFHTTKEMDSIRIKDRRTWKRYSNGTGGDAITFLQEFCGKDFREAVNYLLDFNGKRARDSPVPRPRPAQQTEKGYRVFFSRISLEDKLGTEYEPYIFAALNSARIMLVFGTDYEYFNAVWVKNEWSRFLSLISAGQKKTLIPCFKGIDAYDMPKEFARLQAQDMSNTVMK